MEHDRRRETLAGLSGRVIEIGSGSGPNFRHYPDAVSELVAVEPEPHLRAKAEAAAPGVGAPDPGDRRRRRPPALRGRQIRRRGGGAGALLGARPAGGARRAAPGRAPRRRAALLRARDRDIEAPVASLQRALAPGLAKVFGGCRADRDTGRAIEAAGFRLERNRRFLIRTLNEARRRPGSWAWRAGSRRSVAYSGACVTSA